jgi:hypothetical protein
MSSVLAPEPAASANVRFGQDENTHRRFPGGGATIRFPREAGWGHAMRYMLTADHWGAEEFGGLFHTEDFIEGRKAEAEGRPRLQRQVGLPPARARASVSWPEPSGGSLHSRLVRRSSFLSDAGLRRSTVRRMPTKSNAATSQWNQILCRPVKTLIRTRKPEIVRAAAMGMRHRIQCHWFLGPGRSAPTSRSL